MPKSGSARFAVCQDTLHRNISGSIMGLQAWLCHFGEQHFF